MSAVRYGRLGIGVPAPLILYARALHTFAIALMNPA